MKKSQLISFFFILVIASCTQPKAKKQTAIVVPTLIPSATVIPTPTIEPYIEKLTDEFKEQTEELFGQTSLQEVDDEWSLVDAEGIQAAGFKEGKWWINYALVGPKSIPSWDREEYLCDDNLGKCGIINMKRIAEYEVVDYPFPENFEKNPFVKEEMEWIKNWLTEEMQVPIGQLYGYNESSELQISALKTHLKKISLGEKSKFKWTILPFATFDPEPQYFFPLWLVKEDNSSSHLHFSAEIASWYGKIDGAGNNLVIINDSLKLKYAGTPTYDDKFTKDGSNYYWAIYYELLKRDSYKESFHNNQKWTLIPYADRDDVLLVYESQGLIYRIYLPHLNNSWQLRAYPEK